MNTANRYLLTSILLIATGIAVAETQYVGERILLGVYEQPGSQGRRLMLLKSADQVEVIARQGGSAQIRTADGTVGWVSAGYLTPEQPPSLKVPQLEEQNAELQELLETTRAELEAAREELKQLRTAADAASSESEQEPTERPSQTTMAAGDGSSEAATLSWQVIAALVFAALLAGFGVGVVWLDRRIRRKYHGLRVY